MRLVQRFPPAPAHANLNILRNILRQPKGHIESQRAQEEQRTKGTSGGPGQFPMQVPQLWGGGNKAAQFGKEERNRKPAKKGGVGLMKETRRTPVMVLLRTLEIWTSARSRKCGKLVPGKPVQTSWRTSRQDRTTWTSSCSTRVQPIG